jgi:hypothetical protein
VSPAYQEKARSAFLARIQKPRENIIAYHGVLKTLFEKAYQADERAHQAIYSWSLKPSNQ